MRFRSQHPPSCCYGLLPLVAGAITASALIPLAHLGYGNTTANRSEPTQPHPATVIQHPPPKAQLINYSPQTEDQITVAPVMNSKNDPVFHLNQLAACRPSEHIRQQP